MAEIRPTPAQMAQIRVFCGCRPGDPDPDGAALSVLLAAAVIIDAEAARDGQLSPTNGPPRLLGRAYQERLPRSG